MKKHILAMGGGGFSLDGGIVLNLSAI